MAKDGKKAAIVLGLATVIAGVVIATKAKAAPEEGGVTIRIYDENGNLVPSGSPSALTEGQSYTMVVTVTNMSTKGGTPWEATLTIVVSATVGGNAIMTSSTTNVFFTAGQVKTASYPLVVPLGYGGLSGSALAIVKDPAGVALTSKTEPLTVSAVPIIYGAGIVIGV